MDDTTNRKPLDDDMDDASETTRQHMRNARAEWQRSFAAFFPPEFVQHQRRARREMLLAWRSFLDRAIERTDERIDQAERKEQEDTASSL